MFCEKCGQSLGTDANFCSHCGARVTAPAAVPTISYATSPADRISEDQPIYVLRPTFIGWVTALSVLPIQIFMTIWAGGFCGGFSTLGMKGLQAVGLGGVLPPWFPFVFFACLAFFGIPGVVYFGKMRTYARTEYRFYPNRLEYYEGFLNIQQKSILYRNVQEVTLRKGLIQRRYNLGTIVLSVPADMIAGRGLRGGIQVADIEAPDDVYEAVKKLIRDAQAR